MTTFDERERGAEARFAMDETMRFHAGVRRNRMLGLWVAAKLGKSGEEADAYAKSVIASDFVEKGDEDVFRKVRADLPPEVADAEIRRAMDEMLAQAVAATRASD